MVDIHPSYATRTSLSDAGRALLADPRIATLVTVSPDGSPHAVPAWYLFEDDRFLIGVLSTTRNVAERGEARVLVEFQNGWLSAIGPARLRTGAGTDELREHVADRYLTEAGREHFLEASGVPDDAVIEVEAKRWMSWDMRSSYQTMLSAGFTPEQIAGWFVPIAGHE